MPLRIIGTLRVETKSFSHGILLCALHGLIVSIRVLPTADGDCVDSDGAGNTRRVILRRIEHKHEHHPRAMSAAVIAANKR